MKQISENPEIIREMQRNMNHNDNDKAMEKLYELAVNIMKGAK